ncbi:MAG TPA: NPCBM/NEW2 domain-containing protein [Pyrinomonadaceae bacterium]|jgi:hypothetical protein
MKIINLLFIFSLLCQSIAAQTIPARVKDSSNKNLFVMTLGNVETPLADGTFNPEKDELRLKDGTVKTNYYKETLGIKYYKPIDKSKFPLPPSGWCSWYFYYQEINETEVRRAAEWISENLKDYGAEYVQIDDGWQGTGHGLGENRDWTTVDKRFPGGMRALAAYIKSLGLKPGIWLAPHGQSSAEIVRQNPSVFMLKADGSSASKSWEGDFLVDPSTPETQKYLTGLFKTLKAWGFEYFKIDGQPTVIREFRNKKEFMKNPSAETDALYRATLVSIRAGIGENSYLLGCWIIPLEGVGIMNGSRIGADVLPNWDGFKFALRATMEYYFLHNVAWYNDPDVMIVRAPLTIEQARAWATLQGLTGQAVLMSDRLPDLPADRVEIVRRVYPAVDIRPLDLFKSARNKRIWDLKINHLGRNYDVAGLFNFDETKPAPTFLSWKDLGLPENEPVHVFDFWNKEYLGEFEKGISVDVLPASCRLLTLLPATENIQLISTNRHVTQGWVDLISQKFDAAKNSYSGKSRVIKNDPYELSFVFPRGKNFVVKQATARTAKGNLPVKINNHQGWASVEIASANTTEAAWNVQFEPAEMYRFPVREPQNLWAERSSSSSSGLDGVNLRWNIQHQPATAYQISIDGEVVGFSPTQAFNLPNPDVNKEYTAEVKTVWQDGRLSEKGAKFKFTLKDLLPGEISLSALEPFSLSPGWRQPEMNRTFTGKGLFIRGKHYENGIGMPTNSEIEFEIKGIYDEFSASVGIDDEFNNADGGVEFSLFGDGRELWKSKVLKKADGAAAVNVSIKGVQKLTLKVKRPEGEPGRAPADWVDARLLRQK